MERDDAWPPTVVIEEWLVVLRGLAELDQEAVSAAHAVVDAALLGLVRALEADLAGLGVQLEVASIPY
jgi:hypothetical protein